MKTPCDDCIVIPVCRHKSFGKLLTDCKILKEFDDTHMERDELDYFISLSAIEEVLNPTGWEYKKGENRNPFLIKNGGNR